MSDQNSNVQVISGAIVLVFVSVILFKSCGKSDPAPVATIQVQPITPPTDDELLTVLKDSERFKEHKKVLMDGARTLIVDGRCTIADFKEMGGWVKSTNHKKSSVFFTYCGGLKIQNKVYVDTSDGRIFRDGL